MSSADGVGGRWVPSVYTREVFAGSGGQSRSATVSLELAQGCGAVSRYKRFFTSAQAEAETRSAGHFAEPDVVIDLARQAPGGELTDRITQQAQAPARSKAHGRSKPRDNGRD